MLRPEDALARWSRDEPVAPVPRPGLINRTFAVGEPPSAVLQWVNPIFDPRIHLDLQALSERLAARGLETPRLLPTAEGALFVADDGGGVWRLLSYVPGETVDTLDGPTRAAAAGRRVGLFHAALAGWDHGFHAPPRRVHDTPARMADLAAALAAADGHPLAEPARELGREVLARWETWRGDLDLPERPCHGDLKISNLRFDPASGEAVALIDLDTFGPQTLAAEMGDAWRSWCNRAGEDDPERVALDVDLFGASAEAWLAAAPPISAAERASLVPGIERIALELASRFAADAVANVHFREDRERFPVPGEHNLLRARGQLALAASARERADVCRRIVGGRK